MTLLFHRGCALPDDRFYDVGRHVWAKPEGDSVIVGMTDVAQTMGGRLVNVGWKKPGSRARRGRPLAVIESAKWVGPFVSPVTGLVSATNEETFMADIAAANRDPYGQGWLYKVAPSNWQGERIELEEPERAYELYRHFIDENDIRCFRCEG